MIDGSAAMVDKNAGYAKLPLAVVLVDPEYNNSALCVGDTVNGSSTGGLGFSSSQEDKNAINNSATAVNDILVNFQIKFMINCNLRITNVRYIHKKKDRP